MWKYNGIFRLCVDVAGVKSALTACVEPFTAGGALGEVSQKSYECGTCWWKHSNSSGECDSPPLSGAVSQRDIPWALYPLSRLLPCACCLFVCDAPTFIFTQLPSFCMYCFVSCFGHFTVSWTFSVLACVSISIILFKNCLTVHPADRNPVLAYSEACSRLRRFRFRREPESPAPPHAGRLFRRREKRSKLAPALVLSQQTEEWEIKAFLILNFKQWEIP